MVTPKDDVTGGTEPVLDRRSLLGIAGTATLAGLVGTGTASANSELPGALVLDATGAGAAEYQVETTGECSVTPTLGNEVTATSETSVSGTVEDGYCAVRYEGELRSLGLDGRVGVLLGEDAEAAFPEPGHEIVITAPDEVSYEFVVDGDVERIRDGSDMQAETNNDSIVENADGTWTVEGYTGNGYGDSFQYRGSVESFSPLTGDYHLYVDGEEVAATELTGEEPDDGSEDGADDPDDGTDGSDDGTDQPDEGTDDGADDGDEDTVTTSRLGIVSPASDFSYEFVATGPVQRVQEGTDVDAEDTNDHVEETADGTYRVEGYTGNGYGDSYDVEGEVVEFAPSHDEFTLLLDGEEVTVAELTGGEPDESEDDPQDGEDSLETRRIGIRSPASDFSYEFTATAGAERVQEGTDMDAEDSNDGIEENADGTVTVSGYTGNGYGDSYDVTGEVVEFSPMTGRFTLTVDGEEVSPYELTGQEPPEQPEPSANLGGGAGYPNTVSPSAADYLVSSRSELRSALDAASAGDVVYVDGDADIYMGSVRVTVPRGVTLASDRGIDGSDGGRIRTDAQYGHGADPMIGADSGARITGLRAEGPLGGSGWHEHSLDYEMSGIRAYGSDVEVDNVEAYHWGHSCVYANDGAHVHHCQLHTANLQGLGYGVFTGNSSSELPIVEYNEFWHTRHAVADGGGGGFVVRYNHVDAPGITHVFDQHDPGGTTMRIYNNTVVPVEDQLDGGQIQAVTIRGAPDDTADVYNNWFYNPDEPRDSPTGGWTEEAIVQTDVDSWENVEFWNNHYGSSQPADDVGCPR